MRLPLTMLLALAAVPAAPAVVAAAAQLEECVRQDSATDREEFDDAFEKGPIVLPAGVVFDWAGHVFGDVADPLDLKHMNPGPAVGWRGVSKEEEDRRNRILVEDAGRNQRRTSGLVTLATLRLTKATPCGLVPVAAVRSPAWGWTVAPVFGDPGLYYRPYGVGRQGRLSTDWSKEPGSFGYAAGAGSLNGVLRGTTDRVVDVGE